MSVTSLTSKREANRQEKIAIILEAARELMEESGEAAVSLRKLALKTGLAANTIYAHFGGTRDELVNAIVMHAYADIGLAEDREVSLFKMGETPWELALNQFLEHPAFYRAVTLLRTQQEPLVQAEENLGRLNDKARALLKKAVVDGELSSKCDLKFLEKYFIHLFRGCAHRWAKFEISDEEFRHYLLYGIYTALLHHSTDKGARKTNRFLKKI